MINILDTFTQGPSTQRTAATETPTKDINEKAQSDGQGSSLRQPLTDQVTISPEAERLADELAKAEQAAAKANPRALYYQQFRPTHDGFSSYNMSLAIADPSAQPFSQGRPFAEVSQAARESLDKNYAKLDEMGKPFGGHQTRAEDVNSLFREMDRRALYAVASNEGDLFTKEEQREARDIMRGQQGMAMGLYNGPTALEGRFASYVNLSDPDSSRTMKAGLEFMDRVSAEEKATDVEWASQRAIMQRQYQQNVGPNSSEAKEFEVQNPLVELILDALEEWSSEKVTPLLQEGRLHHDADQQTPPWLAGLLDEIDAALEQSKALYDLN